jgi:hypothetical protein
VISRAAARRIALAAQGFDRPRPARAPGTRQLAELVRRLGVLQLDSVNVFCRAHYMPAFSRLGPYDRKLLDRIAGHAAGDPDGNARRTRRRAPDPSRKLVEYWAHEASLIPVELHPLFRWRMARVHDLAWGSISRIARDRPELVAETLALVTRDGPLRAGATAVQRTPRDVGRMWNWHDGKRALEHLFYTGEVAAAGRVNFERRYDVPRYVLPAAVLEASTPPADEAQRELVRIAARALGVATEPDLGDYFRLPRADSKARVAELVAAGELHPVEVEGWTAPAYLWPDARRPRRIDARALISPFDSLVWFRDRAERLFDFSYRIEIYTPANRRVYGYYVLPFLLGDRLVARVDLKADRANAALLVRGAFAEPGSDPDAVAGELAAELRLAAGWLGLERVLAEPRGDLAPALVTALLHDAH